MTTRGGWLDVAALDAADALWYGDLVAHCGGGSCGSANDATTALEALNTIPWTQCLRLLGDQSEACKYEDSRQQTWADDRKGRWSAQIDGTKAFLHHQVAELQPQPHSRSRQDGDVVSHICGQCDCIRWEHIRFQPKSDDIKDRRHHLKHGAGRIRPELLLCVPVSPMSPGVSTVDRERIRSRVERD